MWRHAERPNIPEGIPVIFLGMDEEILNAFDKVHDNLRVVPSFNGLFWHKTYYQQTFANYPTPEAQILIDFYTYGNPRGDICIEPSPSSGCAECSTEAGN